MGERFEVEVGPVAHGGHCVARASDRVVFVRHTVPGERVVVEITEGTQGDRFWRGDAVSILSSGPERVEPPCPYAGPGLCGGCDFQHVALPAQRELKAAVVREQLARLAGIDVPVTVEAVPDVGTDGLRWRTRMNWARAPDGRPGLHAHRSDRVVPVDDCLIAARSDDDPATERVVVAAGAHEYAVAPVGFWQSHIDAPRVLVDAVLELGKPQRGERVLDLYAGVGLFSAYLADAVGPGRVVAVEGDRDACRHARANLGERVRVEHGPVARVLAHGYDEPFDLVVLDPPREGAKRQVVEQVVDRAPRAVVYVACDPAALARDVGLFGELGYRLETLRSFDLFPMTHHVECVALLVRAR
ncbi:MAG: class I SAM-dependent RNA methyltransferase [Nocardioides sp.]